MTAHAAQPAANHDDIIFGSTPHIISGFVLLVLAGLILGMGMAANSGGGILVLVGAVMAVTGQILLMVGIIAKGVSLGNRES